MRIRLLGLLLALVVTTACASFVRLPTPNWDRYQSGDLAGFLRAPHETAADDVSGGTVRRVRGRVILQFDDGTPFSPDREEFQVSRYVDLTPKKGLHFVGATPARQLVQLDGLSYVVELRGPGPGGKVRTSVTRHGVFDFGDLPNGDYSLKATVRGWRPAVSRITVADSADSAARVSIALAQTVDR
jgi:hypothetical protein